MENENNDKKFGEITYTNISSDKENKKNPTFLKNAFVPFVCSGLATVLVIGVCFGVPNIKNKIIGTSNNNSLSITSGPAAN